MKSHLFKIGCIVSLALLLAAGRADAGEDRQAAGETGLVYLPFVTVPAKQLDTVNLLNNPSFEEGWTDLPPAPGFLINQQPNGWSLEWVEPGEPLFDSNDIAGGVPECIHKLADQLPPNEQPGGPDALILDGETTYKIFHFGQPFGAELRQTVGGLEPGSRLQLRVPVQVHLHGDLLDPFTAESGVWVNGAGEWVNSQLMGDRSWYEHVVEFIVPQNGVVEVIIRVKSKWQRPKDFFIDHIRLHKVLSGPSRPAPNPEAGAWPPPERRIITPARPGGS